MSTAQFEAALGPAKQVQLSTGPVEYHERGEGRPLVFVHGVNLHAGFWRKVVPELARDYRCVVPTWPLGGHRLAQKPDADLSPPGVATLIGELLENLSLEDAVVVGNDTGGAFSQVFAARQPERLGALVLTPSDAMDRFFPPQFAFLQFAARIPGSAWQSAQFARLPAVRRSRLGYGLLTKHGIPDDVSDSYIAPLRASAAVRRDYTKVLRGVDKRHTLEAAEKLRSFERPVLLAWATEDVLFPLSTAHELERRIPNARLVEIADCSTYVPEDQPQRLVEVMREFLAAPGAKDAATDDAQAPAGT